MDMTEDSLYEMAKRIMRQAADSYDPFERIEVKGPFEGKVPFSDGSSYQFTNGKAMIHRKNLQEAYNIGCYRLTRRRSRRQP